MENTKCTDFNGSVFCDLDLSGASTPNFDAYTKIYFKRLITLICRIHNLDKKWESLIINACHSLAPRISNFVSKGLPHLDSVVSFSEAQRKSVEARNRIEAYGNMPVLPVDIEKGLETISMAGHANIYEAGKVHEYFKRARDEFYNRISAGSLDPLQGVKIKRILHSSFSASATKSVKKIELYSSSPKNFKSLEHFHGVVFHLDTLKSKCPSTIKLSGEDVSILLFAGDLDPLNINQNPLTSYSSNNVQPSRELYSRSAKNTNLDGIHDNIKSSSKVVSRVNNASLTSTLELDHERLLNFHKNNINLNSMADNINDSDGLPSFHSRDTRPHPIARLDQWAEQQDHYLTAAVSRIALLRPSIVLVAGSVHPLLFDSLTAMGITVITGVNLKTVLRLGISTGSFVFKSIYQLERLLRISQAIATETSTNFVNEARGRALKLQYEEEKHSLSMWSFFSSKLSSIFSFGKKVESSLPPEDLIAIALHAQFLIKCHSNHPVVTSTSNAINQELFSTKMHKNPNFSCNDYNVLLAKRLECEPRIMLGFAKSIHIVPAESDIVAVSSSFSSTDAPPPLLPNIMTSKVAWELSSVIKIQDSSVGTSTDCNYAATTNGAKPFNRYIRVQIEPLLNSTSYSTILVHADSAQELNRVKQSLKTAIKSLGSIQDERALLAASFSDHSEASANDPANLPSDATIRKIVANCMSSVPLVGGLERWTRSINAPMMTGADPIRGNYEKNNLCSVCRSPTARLHEELGSKLGGCNDNYCSCLSYINTRDDGADSEKFSKSVREQCLDEYFRPVSSCLHKMSSAISSWSFERDISAQLSPLAFKEENGDSHGSLAVYLSAVRKLESLNNKDLRSLERLNKGLLGALDALEKEEEIAAEREDDIRLQFLHDLTTNKIKKNKKKESSPENYNEDQNIDKKRNEAVDSESSSPSSRIKSNTTPLQLQFIKSQISIEHNNLFPIVASLFRRNIDEFHFQRATSSILLPLLMKSIFLSISQSPTHSISRLVAINGLRATSRLRVPYWYLLRLHSVGGFPLMKLLSMPAITSLNENDSRDKSDIDELLDICRTFLDPRVRTLNEAQLLAMRFISDCADIASTETASNGQLIGDGKKWLSTNEQGGEVYWLDLKDQNKNKYYSTIKAMASRSLINNRWDNTNKKNKFQLWEIERDKKKKRKKTIQQKLINFEDKQDYINYHLLNQQQKQELSQEENPEKNETSSPILTSCVLLDKHGRRVPNAFPLSSFSNTLNADLDAQMPLSFSTSKGLTYTPPLVPMGVFLSGDVALAVHAQAEDFLSWEICWPAVLRLCCSGNVSPSLPLELNVAWVCDVERCVNASSSVCLIEGASGDLTVIETLLGYILHYNNSFNDEHVSDKNKCPLTYEEDIQLVPLEASLKNWASNHSGRSHSKDKVNSLSRAAPTVWGGKFFFAPSPSLLSPPSTSLTSQTIPMALAFGSATSFNQRADEGQSFIGRFGTSLNFLYSNIGPSTSAASTANTSPVTPSTLGGISISAGVVGGSGNKCKSGLTKHFLYLTHAERRLVFKFSEVSPSALAVLVASVASRRSPSQFQVFAEQSERNKSRNQHLSERTNRNDHSNSSTINVRKSQFVNLALVNLFKDLQYQLTKKISANIMNGYYDNVTNPSTSLNDSFNMESSDKFYSIQSSFNPMATTSTRHTEHNPLKPNINTSENNHNKKNDSDSSKNNKNNNSERTSRLFSHRCSPFFPSVSPGTSRTDATRRLSLIFDSFTSAFPFNAVLDEIPANSSIPKHLLNDPPTFITFLHCTTCDKDVTPPQVLPESLASSSFARFVKFTLFSDHLEGPCKHKLHSEVVRIIVFVPTGVQIIIGSEKTPVFDLQRQPVTPHINASHPHFEGVSKSLSSNTFQGITNSNLMNLSRVNNILSRPSISSFLRASIVNGSLTNGGVLAIPNVMSKNWNPKFFNFGVLGSIPSRKSTAQTRAKSENRSFHHHPSPQAHVSGIFNSASNIQHANSVSYLNSQNNLKKLTNSCIVDMASEPYEMNLHLPLSLSQKKSKLFSQQHGSYPLSYPLIQAAREFNRHVRVSLCPITTKKVKIIPIYQQKNQVSDSLNDSKSTEEKSDSDTSRKLSTIKVVLKKPSIKFSITSLAHEKQVKSNYSPPPKHVMNNTPHEPESPLTAFYNPNPFSDWECLPPLPDRSLQQMDNSFGSPSPQFTFLLPSHISSDALLSGKSFSMHDYLSKLNVIESEVLKVLPAAIDVLDSMINTCMHLPLLFSIPPHVRSAHLSTVMFLHEVMCAIQEKLGSILCRLSIAEQLTPDILVVESLNAELSESLPPLNVLTSMFSSQLWLSSIGNTSLLTAAHRSVIVDTLMNRVQSASVMIHHGNDHNISHSGTISHPIINNNNNNNNFHVNSSNSPSNLLLLGSSVRSDSSKEEPNLPKNSFHVSPQAELGALNTTFSQTQLQHNPEAIITNSKHNPNSGSGIISPPSITTAATSKNVRGRIKPSINISHLHQNNNKNNSQFVKNHQQRRHRISISVHPLFNSQSCLNINHSNPASKVPGIAPPYTAIDLPPVSPTSINKTNISINEPITPDDPYPHSNLNNTSDHHSIQAMSPQSQPTPPRVFICPPSPPRANPRFRRCISCPADVASLSDYIQNIPIHSEASVFNRSGDDLSLFTVASTNSVTSPQPPLPVANSSFASSLPTINNNNPLHPKRSSLQSIISHLNHRILSHTNGNNHSNGILNDSSANLIGMTSKPDVTPPTAAVASGGLNHLPQLTMNSNSQLFGDCNFNFPALHLRQNTFSNNFFQRSNSSLQTDEPCLVCEPRTVSSRLLASRWMHDAVSHCILFGFNDLADKTVLANSLGLGCDHNLASLSNSNLPLNMRALMGSANCAAYLRADYKYSTVIRYRNLERAFIPSTTMSPEDAFAVTSQRYNITNLNSNNPAATLPSLLPPPWWITTNTTIPSDCIDECQVSVYHPLFSFFKPIVVQNHANFPLQAQPHLPLCTIGISAFADNKKLAILSIRLIRSIRVTGNSFNMTNINSTSNFLHGVGIDGSVPVPVSVHPTMRRESISHGQHQSAPNSTSAAASPTNVVTAGITDEQPIVPSSLSNNFMNSTPVLRQSSSSSSSSKSSYQSHTKNNTNPQSFIDNSSKVFIPSSVNCSAPPFEAERLTSQMNDIDLSNTFSELVGVKDSAAQTVLEWGNNANKGLLKDRLLSNSDEDPDERLSLPISISSSHLTSSSESASSVSDNQDEKERFDLDGGANLKRQNSNAGSYLSSHENLHHQQQQNQLQHHPKTSSYTSSNVLYRHFSSNTQRSSTNNTLLPQRTSRTIPQRAFSSMSPRPNTEHSSSFLNLLFLAAPVVFPVIPAFVSLPNNNFNSPSHHPQQQQQSGANKSSYLNVKGNSSPVRVTVEVLSNVKLSLPVIPGAQASEPDHSGEAVSILDVDDGSFDDGSTQLGRFGTEAKSAMKEEQVMKTPTLMPISDSLLLGNSNNSSESYTQSETVPNSDIHATISSNILLSKSSKNNGNTTSLNEASPSSLVENTSQHNISTSNTFSAINNNNSSSNILQNVSTGNAIIKTANSNPTTNIIGETAHYIDPFVLRTFLCKQLSLAWNSRLPLPPPPPSLPRVQLGLSISVHSSSVGSILAYGLLCPPFWNSLCTAWMQSSGVGCCPVARIKAEEYVGSSLKREASLELIKYQDESSNYNNIINIVCPKHKERSEKIQHLFEKIGIKWDEKRKKEEAAAALKLNASASELDTNIDANSPVNRQTSDSVNSVRKQKKSLFGLSTQVKNSDRMLKPRLGLNKLERVLKEFGAAVSRNNNRESDYIKKLVDDLEDSNIPNLGATPTSINHESGNGGAQSVTDTANSDVKDFFDETMLSDHGSTARDEKDRLNLISSENLQDIGSSVNDLIAEDDDEDAEDFSDTDANEIDLEETIISDESEYEEENSEIDPLEVCLADFDANKEVSFTASVNDSELSSDCSFSLSQSDSDSSFFSSYFSSTDSDLDPTEFSESNQENIAKPRTKKAKKKRFGKNVCYNNNNNNKMANPMSWRSLFEISKLTGLRVSGTPRATFFSCDPSTPLPSVRNACTCEVLLSRLQIFKETGTLPNLPLPCPSPSCDPVTEAFGSCGCLFSAPLLLPDGDSFDHIPPLRYPSPPGVRNHHAQDSIKFQTDSLEQKLKQRSKFSRHRNNDHETLNSTSNESNPVIFAQSVVSESTWTNAELAVIEEEISSPLRLHVKTDFETIYGEKYQVIIYYAPQFHALRHFLCGDELNFARSLVSSAAFLAEGGKSGASFQQTEDKRFVIKEINKYELKLFLQSGPAILQFMSKVLLHDMPSTLAPIYGLFQVSHKVKAVNNSTAAPSNANEKDKSKPNNNTDFWGDQYSGDNRRDGLGETNKIIGKVGNDSNIDNKNTLDNNTSVNHHHQQQSHNQTTGNNNASNPNTGNSAHNVKNVQQQPNNGYSSRWRRTFIIMQNAKAEYDCVHASIAASDKNSSEGLNPSSNIRDSKPSISSESISGLLSKAASPGIFGSSSLPKSGGTGVIPHYQLNNSHAAASNHGSHVSSPANNNSQPSLVTFDLKGVGRQRLQAVASHPYLSGQLNKINNTFTQQKNIPSLLQNFPSLFPTTSAVPPKDSDLNNEDNLASKDENIKNEKENEKEEENIKENDVMNGTSNEANDNTSPISIIQFIDSVSHSHNQKQLGEMPNQSQAEESQQTKSNNTSFLTGLLKNYKNRNQNSANSTTTTSNNDKIPSMDHLVPSPPAQDGWQPLLSHASILTPNHGGTSHNNSTANSNAVPIARLVVSHAPNKEYPQQSTTVVPQLSVLWDQNLRLYTGGLPLLLQESCMRFLSPALYNDTLLLSKLEIVDYSLLVLIDVDNKTIFLSMIDYLRPFTWDKQVETVSKQIVLLGRGLRPTVLQPLEYLSRFKAAMKSYFAVPYPCYPSILLPLEGADEVNGILEMSRTEYRRKSQQHLAYRIWIDRAKKVHAAAVDRALHELGVIFEGDSGNRGHSLNRKKNKSTIQLDNCKKRSIINDDDDNDDDDVYEDVEGSYKLNQENNHLNAGNDNQFPLNNNSWSFETARSCAQYANQTLIQQQNKSSILIHSALPNNETRTKYPSCLGTSQGSGLVSIGETGPTVLAHHESFLPSVEEEEEMKSEYCASCFDRLHLRSRRNVKIHPSRGHSEDEVVVEEENSIKQNFADEDKNEDSIAKKSISTLSTSRATSLFSRASAHVDHLVEKKTTASRSLSEGDPSKNSQVLIKDEDDAIQRNKNTLKRSMHNKAVNSAAFDTSSSNPKNKTKHVTSFPAFQSSSKSSTINYNKNSNNIRVGNNALDTKNSSSIGAAIPKRRLTGWQSTIAAASSSTSAQLKSARSSTIVLTSKPFDNDWNLVMFGDDRAKMHQEGDQQHVLNSTTRSGGRYQNLKENGVTSDLSYGVKSNEGDDKNQKQMKKKVGFKTFVSAFLPEDNDDIGALSLSSMSSESESSDISSILPIPTSNVGSQNDISNPSLIANSKIPLDDDKTKNSYKFLNMNVESQDHFNRRKVMNSTMESRKEISASSQLISNSIPKQFIASSLPFNNNKNEGGIGNIDSNKITDAEKFTHEETTPLNPPQDISPLNIPAILIGSKFVSHNSSANQTTDGRSLSPSSYLPVSSTPAIIRGSRKHLSAAGISFGALPTASNLSNTTVFVGGSTPSIMYNPPLKSTYNGEGSFESLRTPPGFRFSPLSSSTLHQSQDIVAGPSLVMPSFSLQPKSISLTVPSHMQNNNYNNSNTNLLPSPRSVSGDLNVSSNTTEEISSTPSLNFWSSSIHHPRRKFNINTAGSANSSLNNSSITNSRSKIANQPIHSGNFSFIDNRKELWSKNIQMRSSSSSLLLDDGNDMQGKHPSVIQPRLHIESPIVTDSSGSLSDDSSSSG